MNYQKVLFRTAIVHPCHFIMYTRNFLCSTFLSEESSPVETFPIEQSSHELPEIAIGIIFASLKFHEDLTLIRFSEVYLGLLFLLILGSIKEYGIHDPQCQCQHCDSNGVCLKTCGCNLSPERHVSKVSFLVFFGGGV